MKRIIILFSLLSAFTGFSQISVNGGPSMLVGFGAPKPWGGFHVGIDIPKNEDVTFQIQYQYMFKQKSKDFFQGVATAKDGLTIPFNVQVNPSMDFHLISGGTRYYFINGYDYGFSLYGGGNFSIIFNSIRAKTTAFDEDKYELDEFSSAYERASLINLAAGLSGGMKYSISNVGSIYLDLGLTYMIFSKDNKQGRVLQGMFDVGLYNQLLLNFQIGFRRDISWGDE